MSDINVKEQLTWFENLSILLYRISYLTLSFCFIFISIDYFYLANSKLSSIIVTILIFSCALNLHVYMKNIRYLVRSLAGLGFILMLLSLKVDLGNIYLIPSFIALSIMFIKEFFCFHIKLIRLGVFLMILISLIIGLEFFFTIPIYLRLMTILYGILAIITLWLTINKFKMPLHYDFGDRSKYQ